MLIFPGLLAREREECVFVALSRACPVAGSGAQQLLSGEWLMSAATLDFFSSVGVEDTAELILLAAECRRRHWFPICLSWRRV